MGNCDVNVKGKKCLDYVKVLEQLADVKITKQEYTREYYEQEEEYITQELCELGLDIVLTIVPPFLLSGSRPQHLSGCCFLFHWFDTSFDERDFIIG